MEREQCRWASEEWMEKEEAMVIIEFGIVFNNCRLHHCWLLYFGLNIMKFAVTIALCHRSIHC